MGSWCPNCGRNVEPDEKFCRQCGMAQHLQGEAATTWILSQPDPESKRPTAPVQSNTTSPTTPPTAPPTGNNIPSTPTPHYQQPYPVTYQSPAQQGHSHIALGDWLSGGWQVYKENGALMSAATLLAAVLGTVTGGVLAGPLLMGLLRMAFKTMRGERPEMGDLFNWQGKFLQAFLAFLIFAAVNLGLFEAGRFFLVLSLVVVNPLAIIGLAFVLGLILERNMDIAHAIDEVKRKIFTRDAIMWWVVGLVLSTLSGAGTIGCILGSLVTVPWMISASAVAYRDVFGIDDPNRTLH
jgi:hypothetical protein